MSDRIDLSNPPTVRQSGPADVPVDAVPLPSKGICYPVSHPLHGKELVEISPMTAREEDILTSRALLKQGKALSSLIKSCLIDKDIDADGLLSGDRNAILTAIRITGYGQEYRVEVMCPNCSTTRKYTFDLSKLPVKSLDVDPISVGTNEFAFDLPVSKRKVIFKLQTGESEKEVTDAQETALEKLGPAAEAPVTTRLFYHIISIDGETDKQKLARLITKMRAGDSKALRNYMDKIAPGVEMVQQFVCDSCGKKAEVDVPMSTEFFWPSNG